MQGLYQICDREGINVFCRPLDPVRKKTLGMYFRTPGGNPVIVLDPSLRSNPRKKREVFAEEVGHYFTVPIGEALTARFSTIRDGLIVSRDETRAIRWAANYLVPTKALADAVIKGIRSVPDLAEHFYVSEWMLWRKFEALKVDLKQHHGLRVRKPDLFSRILVGTAWGESLSANFWP